MIELVVLGLIAAVFAVASLLLLLLLLDLLVRRADVTAALVIGSTLLTHSSPKQSHRSHCQAT